MKQDPCHLTCSRESRHAHGHAHWGMPQRACWRCVLWVSTMCWRHMVGCACCAGGCTAPDAIGQGCERCRHCCTVMLNLAACDLSNIENCRLSLLHFTTCDCNAASDIMPNLSCVKGQVDIYDGCCISPAWTLHMSRFELTFSCRQHMSCQHALLTWMWSHLGAMVMAVVG